MGSGASGERMDGAGGERLAADTPMPRASAVVRRPYDARSTTSGGANPLSAAHMPQPRTARARGALVSSSSRAELIDDVVDDPLLESLHILRHQAHLRVLATQLHLQACMRLARPLQLVRQSRLAG